MNLKLHGHPPTHYDEGGVCKEPLELLEVSLTTDARTLARIATALRAISEQMDMCPDQDHWHMRTTLDKPDIVICRSPA